MVVEMIINVVSSGIAWIVVAGFAYFLFSLWRDAKNALKD